MEILTKKKCLPCEGIGRAFTPTEVKTRIKDIPGWKAAPDSKSIERSFTMPNFVACVDLINRIKDIAQEENHHPDLHLTGYRNLKVVLNTHSLGGVTENDLILAAKISSSSE